MRSRVETMGLVMPVIPLPYHSLHLWECIRMAQAFSVPEESSAHHVRDLRICAGRLGWVNEIFFEYTSESWFANARRLTLLGRGGDSAVPDVFALEVTAICNLFDYKVECLHSRRNPGSYGAATELGRPLAIRVSYLGGRRCCTWDWSSPEGGILREIGCIDRGPHRIPAALSTFRPATSPRLSAICLDSTHVPITDRSVEP